jgi:hypothetical protein
MSLMPTRAGDIVITHHVGGHPPYLVWVAAADGQQQSGVDIEAGAIELDEALAEARHLAHLTGGAIFLREQGSLAWTPIASVSPT